MECRLLLVACLLLIGCSEETADSDFHQSNTDELTCVDNESDDINQSAKQNESVEQEENDEWSKEEKLIMFHNGRGTMCIEMLEYLEEAEICDKIVIEEHLTDEPDAYSLLSKLESDAGQSIGRSDSFGFLPITFVSGNAYSGFDNEIKDMIQRDIDKRCR